MYHTCLNVYGAEGSASPTGQRFASNLPTTRALAVSATELGSEKNGVHNKRHQPISNPSAIASKDDSQSLTHYYSISHVTTAGPYAVKLIVCTSTSNTFPPSFPLAHSPFYEGSCSSAFGIRALLYTDVPIRVTDGTRIVGKSRCAEF